MAEVEKDRPSFSREPGGAEAGFLNGRAGPLPAEGATVPGWRLRWQGLSGRRGRNQRDGEGK